MEKRKDKKRNKTIRMTIAVLTVTAMIFSCCFGYALETANRYTGKTYVHSSVHDSEVLCNGIDVSAYQNTMDWQKMKSQGIDFAIVRAGYTGYGTGSKNADTWFERHMEGAKGAGMMLGVYYYSQATTPEEAVAEADYTVKLIKKAGYTADDLALPVFMDYEKVSASNGRINKLSKSTRTKCAKAFLEEIALQGFEPGIYSDYSFGKNSVDGAALAKSYVYWGAQYNVSNDFAFVNRLWQYSDSGNVAGSSGRLDMNFWYIQPEAAAAEIGEDVITGYGENEEAEEVPTVIYRPVGISLSDSTCTVNSKKYTYNKGKAYKPDVTVKYGGMRLTEGVDYRLEYVGNTQAGTAYARVRGIGNYQDYKLASFDIAPDSNLKGFTLGSLSNRKYNGKVNKPTSIKVTDSEGNVMKSGVDYIISAPDSKDAGTYSLTVSFVGNYTGTKTADYTIVKASPVVSIAYVPETLTVGCEDFDLGASVNFEEATLKYKSSDKGIATVSKDGMVHVVGPGTATITAYCEESNNLMAAEKSIEIYAKGPQKVTTSYSKYSKDVTSGSFCLNAKTKGDGEISYEVETVETLNPESDESETADEESAEANNPVLRVLSSGRVVIEGPGTALIHVKASETEQYQAGEKTVTVVVSDLDADTAAAKNAAIKKAVEGTKITGLKATPAKKSIKLQWSKTSAKYGVDFYQVYRSTKKSSGYKKIYSTAKNSEKTYTDESLTKGTTYYYKVRGVRYVEGKCVYTPFLKIQTATKK